MKTNELTYKELRELLDNLEKQNNELQQFINQQESIIDDLISDNKKLKDRLFEAEKDYLIETSDISDMLYLEDWINELEHEIYNE